MSESELELDLDELESAEDFLNYFDIEYDQSIVHVNRLHILQRFHDYLSKVEGLSDMDEEGMRAAYTEQLMRAYQDFVASNAQTEKVFKVFHMNEPQQTFVPLDQLIK